MFKYSTHLISDLLAITVFICFGVIAGIINVSAGGGSTLTLPTLIFLGLDSSAANGTNRIAILLLNVSAVQSFKPEKYFDFKTSLKLSVFTLLGAIAGAVLVVRIEDEIFQKILGIVMIGIIISMILPNNSVRNDQ